MSFETIPQTINTSVSNAQSFLDEKANALLAPKSAEGISGFVFDVPGSENITLATDVTDHFTEDNSFVQDHVTNKPITLQLTGFVGELFYERPRGVAGAVANVQNRLETVEAYLGDYTPAAVQQTQAVIGQAQTAISAINQNIQRLQNVVGLFEGEGPEETRQQRAYRDLFALREQRTVVTVQTPFAYFDSMIITNISFNQPEDSMDIADIAVDLKEFRTAEVRTANFDQDLFPVREQIQSAEEEDQGAVRGTTRNSSVLFDVFGRTG